MRYPYTFHFAHAHHRSTRNTMEEFRRLTRLPAYVFNITGELKASARKRGEDIIDFGMGNPDGATPRFIVDKLIEAVQRTTTHRYSLSKGVPRLRKAICGWYKRRYNVDLNPETEAIVTIGSKEGIAHLCLAMLDDQDTARSSRASRSTAQPQTRSSNSLSTNSRACRRAPSCSS